MPIGLGSFVHWDRMLDGKIAQAVMSIPAVKSVSIVIKTALDLLAVDAPERM